MCQKIKAQGPISAVDPLNKCHLSARVLAAVFPVWSSCLAQSHQELQNNVHSGT